MVNDTTLLLDLDGVSVIRVERCEGGGRRVHLATADASARACPACGVFASRVKGSAIRGRSTSQSAPRRPSGTDADRVTGPNGSAVKPFSRPVDTVIGVVAGFGIGVGAAIMGVAGGELLIPTIMLLALRR
ncbi:hypothetical protein M2156_000107 [Streptomyces sp. SAI-149]|nr:hypothetical protein [Streptomyces sp. SAI-149]